MPHAGHSRPLTPSELQGSLSPTSSQSSAGSRQDRPGSSRFRRNHQGSDGIPDDHLSPVTSRHMVDGSDHDQADGNDHGHDQSSRRRSSAGRGENDRITVRRREANRLAAQRFRSRKKGYQDQLEERVRALEGERDVLIRQLDESLPPGPRTTNSSRQPRSSNLRSSQADGMDVDGHGAGSSSGSGANTGAGLAPGSSSRSSAMRTSGPLRNSASPDRREAAAPYDADVRIAALESANRRLQETLRNLHDENDELRKELRRWRIWGREVRNEDARRNDMMDADQYGHRPNLPRIGSSTSVYSTSIHSGQPGQGPGPMLVDGQDRQPMQLPSLRLPPIRTTLPPDGATLPSPPFSTSLRQYGTSMDGRSPHLDQPR
ncbi:hypothetical protein I317_01808 [Kwoniella heveanensis CBS 569]|nr:hypothetical protein I317_01808 [Kwoniella heveanensis CBS 569]